MSALAEPACIIDGRHGIYLPQIWAELYGSSAVEAAGVKAGDVTTLLLGPTDDSYCDYWESWERVLNDYNHEVDGIHHYLIQEGDLFEYPETCDMSDFWG